MTENHTNSHFPVLLNLQESTWWQASHCSLQSSQVWLDYKERSDDMSLWLKVFAHYRAGLPVDEWRGRVQDVFLGMGGWKVVRFGANLAKKKVTLLTAPINKTWKKNSPQLFQHWQEAMWSFNCWWTYLRLSKPLCNIPTVHCCYATFHKSIVPFLSWEVHQRFLLSGVMRGSDRVELVDTESHSLGQMESKLWLFSPPAGPSH